MFENHLQSEIEISCKRLEKTRRFIRSFALASLKRQESEWVQFMRQKPVGNYIVDLYCSKLKLVIKIDGESHNGRFQYDMERQRFLESGGLTVLRFNDIEVKKDIGNVLMAIEGWMKGSNNNPLTPFVKGE